MPRSRRGRAAPNGGFDAYSPREIADRVQGLCVAVFPIAAFVAAGFEHSVANMYFRLPG